MQGGWTVVKHHLQLLPQQAQHAAKQQRVMLAIASVPHRVYGCALVVLGNKQAGTPLCLG
jgi:hypothetical protein